MSKHTLDDLKAFAAYGGVDAHASFVKHVAQSALARIPDPDDLHRTCDLARVGARQTWRDARYSGANAMLEDDNRIVSRVRNTLEEA